MVEITLANNEETIALSKTEETKVNGVFSFQNLSNRTLRWSTEAFSATNQGSIIDAKSERIFSLATTIYFQKKMISSKVQCRSVKL